MSAFGIEICGVGELAGMGEGNGIEVGNVPGEMLVVEHEITPSASKIDEIKRVSFPFIVSAHK